jgi:hypothetical protein
MPDTSASGRDDSTGTRRLVPTTAPHPNACGERVPCPAHGLVNGHYRPAERVVGRWATLIYANDCGRSWREERAA